MIDLDKICYIFAAGDFEGKITKGKDDLIIAADAGYHHLKKSGLTPDILLGDFDTIGEIPSHENIVRFSAEKDFTDTELAIIEGIKHGYKRFEILGALGGKRLEHTIANIALSSSYAEKGYDISLTDGNYVVKALHNGKFSFDGNEKGFVSVFPFGGKADGVYESGLKYSLENACLDSSNPTLGVSNEFTGRKAEISVRDGTIIIIWQKSQK